MLSDAEVEQFVDEGYVALRSAFTVRLARECRELAERQLGIDPMAPETWTRQVLRGLVEGRPLRDAANSPRLLASVRQLLDPDVWLPRPNLGNVVVRFPSVADPGDAGFHIDASFQPEGDRRWFVNYRSRGRGLLLLCLLSDVGTDDAPSRLLPGSHLAMPKLLRPAGEPGLPGAYAGQQSEIPLPDTGGRVVVATGEPGDVFVCHPFLVHAASWPHRGPVPRFVAQPPIALLDALRLDGDLRQLSPVARAVRRGLDR